MWAWCAALAGAALATRFIPFREGGVWHLWETVAVAGIALVAIAMSLYVVYVLEIVKLNNPRRLRPGTTLRRAPFGLAETLGFELQGWVPQARSGGFTLC